MPPSIQSVLISGQKVNSRTETLEFYCKKNFQHVGVFAFSSPLARHGASRWTVYRDGESVEQRELPSSYCPAGRWKWLFLPWIFIGVILRAVRCVRRTSRRDRRVWDCFVGIALVSTLLGLVLRSLGVVRKVVYYCLDYYTPPRSPWPDRMAMKFFLRLDRWAARRCDENWIICDRIAGARHERVSLDPSGYHWVEVPLGYDDSILLHAEPDDFDPKAIGFVGSLSDNQGLQGVIKAMPGLLDRHPGVKLHIIGTGPYEGELRRLVGEAGLGGSVVFHGFVAEESEVMQRLSRCAVGLATWTGEEADNARYADPGKPKLYAMCGIPTLITDVPKVAELLERDGAGRAIPYDPKRIGEALDSMLADINGLRSMRANARKFAFNHCLSRVYFDHAFERMPQ